VTARNKCPECGSYRVWHSGKVLFWAGVVIALLAVPWSFLVIGIPFLLTGLLLAFTGAKRMRRGNPLNCRSCGWVEHKA
jgi:hypothetical protein